MMMLMMMMMMMILSIDVVKAPVFPHGMHTHTHQPVDHRRISNHSPHLVTRGDGPVTASSVLPGHCSGQASHGTNEVGSRSAPKYLSGGDPGSCRF